MEHLPGDFADELLISRLTEKPKIAKEMIATHHKDLYRLSGENTLAIQVFAGMNFTQMQKLGCGIEYLTIGLRLTAPIQVIISLKKEYLQKTFTK